jgi:hypothetical protein
MVVTILVIGGGMALFPSAVVICWCRRNGMVLSG